MPLRRPFRHKAVRGEDMRRPSACGVPRQQRPTNPGEKSLLPRVRRQKRIAVKATLCRGQAGLRPEPTNRSDESLVSIASHSTRRMLLSPSEDRSRIGRGTLRPERIPRRNVSTHQGESWHEKDWIIATPSGSDDGLVGSGRFGRHRLARRRPRAEARRRSPSAALRPPLPRPPGQNSSLPARSIPGP